MTYKALGENKPNGFKQYLLEKNINHTQYAMIQNVDLETSQQIITKILTLIPYIQFNQNPRLCLYYYVHDY